MTTSSTHVIRVGANVWWDGSTWEVESLTESAARLRRDDEVQAVSFAALAADSLSGSLDGDRVPVDTAPPSGVLLAALPPSARKALEEEALHLMELQRPDPDRTRADRLRSKAEELGVSTRTLQRRLARFEAQGVAGLIDARLLKEGRRSVDPRWDSACLEVLHRYSHSSTPTRRTVIRHANTTYLEAVPGGRVPSDRVAYRRLAELDKGRYTFGPSKQRRSVTERPTGVLGRLRADYPGQYLVMDSTRLDVFAMEPITLRWVNVELTVAMDLYSRCITGDCCTNR
ncbi:helix-turn-helix domain-containing protein [Luteipulveratus halotolerans]|uniref:helix-turn-helix domain-containing protein n=1 Tax=Luteipulveratus halotolerans TaxID=1631356 RepID=UPI0008FBDA1E|nr:helix-turn-helix domain-containing protein [Luteipulveratus halotolerans]